jgi:hypothetical protein
MQQDLQQLNLLGIFHYVWGALYCLIGILAAGIMVFMGLYLTAAPQVSSSDDSVSQSAAGGVMIGAGVFVFLICVVYGVLTLMAGGKYRKHQGGWTFCLVLAVITCLTGFPLGTALGIFAIVVLNRPTVKALFKGESLPGTPGAALQTPPIS